MSRIEDVLPLSSLQQGMLFHALFDERAVDVHTVQTVLDLEGALDAPRLRAAATELLRRHANLRAAFVHDTGDPVAVVLRDVEAPWTEHDLSTMDEPARAAAIDRLLATDRAIRFAMQEPPLVRFLLLRTASERHRLVVSNHHILLDGWSMPLLVRELLALYAGERVPRVRPYRDYLAWLRTRDRAAGAALWAGALADPPPPTLVAPASAALGAALPSRVPVPVPDATWDALTALARRHGLTPNTVLQGAWGLVLARALGRDDVVFGATVSGRPSTVDGVADMVGLFVNTLPVRVRLRPAEPVSELLARLQSEQAALLDHQYLGLTELGAAELFDTLFVFESYPVDVDAIGSAEEAAGLRVRGADSADATNYPLALTAGPGDDATDGRLVLSLDHRPDVLDAATAHRWAAWLARALDAIVAGPDLPLARLDLLDDHELATVTALSAGPDALPLNATVLDELHARTAATPNAVAVVAADGALTFAELDDRAWRLARLLAARGAGPERTVAVLLPRTTDLVVAMVAAWKAGAAFAVVDPAYPDERIRLVLEDLDPAVLVTEDVLRDRPRPNGIVLQRPSLANAAYVLHTSGTTGRPKGVVVPHRALANLLAAHRAGAMAGRQRMRVLGTASFAFDAALDQLLWMIAGHELHLADEHTRHDPDALVDLVRTKGIGHLDAAPALLAQLVAGGLLDAPDLAVVTTGGEAVPALLWERLASSGVDAYDCYGPTEATVDATVGLIGPGSPHIGRPVAGARVHVLDRGLAPVAPGVPGELYLGGEPLARGYLGRPGATAERFVANPFGAGRLYRTGDLVRWNDSGVLEFLGRTDDQLSVRGFRVEPGEIEAALAAHPAVTAAAVVARADGPGTAHLVAYAQTSADPDELRAHLAARLPEHLVPDLVVALDALPVTPHGKIDKRALPAPTRSAATHRAPASPLEERLCALFAEVLGLPRVSPDESFFALGGDSIVSMQLVGRARAAGLAFSPRDVFEVRTPAALAARVNGDTADDGQLATADAETLARWRTRYPGLVDVWPLTPLQEGLLFHAQFDAGDPGSIDLYAVQSELELAGPLDHDRLRDAGRELLARHENLRTAFVHDDDRPVQVVLDRVELPWTEIDLSGRDEDTRAAEVERIVAADRVRRFDLTRPPLLRCTLIRLAEDRHRLLITNHHIVLDGWSSPIVVADLFALYSGERPPPVRPFRDHLAWLAGRDRDTSREAWRRALDGVSEPTLLVPAATAVEAAVPEQRGIDLDDRLTARLTALARDSGVTPNAVVQAAWGVVLGRLTGRSDVVFGATVSGRAPELAGSEHMVGLFVNTVPVRVRLDAREPLCALVKRVQAEQTALLDHQYLGLGELPGGGELFDTLTVFESYPVDEESLATAEAATGLRTVAVDGRDATHYPVVLVAIPGERLHLGLKYLPYAADRAAHLLDRVVRVLATLADTPELPCGQVDVLAAGERAQVVESWNATGSELGAEDVSLFGLFVEQVAAVPDAIAVGPLTYAELDVRVSVLAGVLRDAGVGPETLVGVHVRRSVDLVVALLAVLKAGGAFVPLQPEWPVERLAALYSSAGLRHVVTAGGPLPDAPDVHVVDVHASAAPLTEPVRVDPESLAYVIFTSGSTGVPKGAMIRHRAICARLRWQRGLLGFGPGDAALFKAPLGFDISINEIFLPLTTGARLVIAAPDGERDADYLLDVITRERVSFAYLVSSMVDVMLEMPAVHDAAASLKHVWCGGEVLTPALFDRFRAVFRDSVLYHGYGPAEATIGTSHRFYRGEDRRTSITIGRPNPNTQMYVLDANLRPCPVGALGELYAGGLPLGRGYVGDPGQTSARFVANPYGAPGSRLYRTGDLGRWAANGELEFVGRADHQVKIRGMRVELEEIDAVLARHPAVRQAVTVVRKDTLAAYVTTAAPATEEALRAHVAAHLPEHMVPGTVTTLESFPLNANGKVDRAALPDPEAPAGRAPSTPLEHRLAALFAAVLDRPEVGQVGQVGVDDSFFALGGHSLLATRLVARIRAELRTDLPLRAVFEHPTVAGLARRLDVTTGPTRPALLPRPRPEKVPLSPAQRRLWFLYQLDGPSPTYDIPFVFRMDTGLDVPAFRAALRDVVGRHEALRTVLVSDQDGPWQRVVPLDAVYLDVPVVDTMADLPRTNGFELDREPPLRCALVRTAEADTVVLVVHHVAADEWSADVLFTDLTTAYEARRAGTAPDWQPLPVQYADYALWQRDLLGAEDDPASLAGRQLDHWRTALAGLPERVPLPTDRPAPPVASHDGATVAFTVAPAVYARLRELARNAGATEFMAVTAAVAAVLHKLGAGGDVPLGTAVAGRTDAALDALVGFFVNTVVLRADTSGDPTLRELLARVRDTALDAYANADVPFERIVEVLNPHRSLGHHSLFQTMVLLQQRTAGTTAVTAVDTGVDEPTAAKFDLAVEFVEDDAGGLDAVIVHRTDLFDRATIARLAERLGTALDAMGSAPDTRLAELDVLTEDERAPRPAPEPVPHNTIPALFTAQVRRTPDAPAVDGLTYAELDARANRLAHLLVARGAGPERTVAIALPRDAELVIAVLAVLKAGAAYLPLDPAYPLPRLRFMLDDAAPALLLTTAGGLGGPDSDARDGPDRPDALGGTRRLCLDTEGARAELAAAPPTEPASAGAVLPDHLAYLIYTSGSTGRPKGVAVPHRNVAGLVAWAVATFGPKRLARTVFSTSLSFDVSVFELFAPLLSGGSVRVVPDVLSVPEVEEPTLVSAVPSALAAMLDRGDSTALAPPSTAIVLAGEAATWDLVRALRAGAPDRPVFDFFGPTETTVYSTGTTLGTPTPGPVPIGVPVTGTVALVLDAALRPVPTGVPGELYLGGGHLARGYHARPGLTATRFVADPDGPPGARLYRTGDLVRRTNSGELEFLGRADQQVKLRGFRIEPGEVEAAIRTHPAVAGAAVVARDDSLVAYVVPAEVSSVELRGYLAERLPAHLVPTAVVTMDALPLTPNGKLDRAALPAPHHTATAEPRRPSTPAQRRLLALFADVLGVPEVGVDDSFFDLGGHSLLATRLAARIREAMHTNVSVRTVFEAPTVAGLAERLGRAAPFDPVLTLRAGAPQRPALFCLPPAIGLGWSYARLLPHLDDDQPVHAVQTTGLPAAAVDELAAACADFVTRTRPDGPYLLLGWSFGAVLAHAVAARLTAGGHAVPLVVMLDGYPERPPDDPEPMGEADALYELLLFTGYDTSGLTEDGFGIDTVRAVVADQGGVLGGVGEAELLAAAARIAAVATLRYGEFATLDDTHLLFVRAHDDGTPPATDWQPHYIRPMTVHEVAATHLDLLDPEPLRTIGPVLRQAVAKGAP